MSLATPTAIRSLQKKLYTAAKAEPTRRFHQLYDKVYREDIVAHAYRLARAADGAPGVDGQSFEDIEAQGLEEWLGGLGQELRARMYRPAPVRRVMIPKPGGGERPLGIPTIRDRVVQTAAKLVLEPIFEADFEDCAYGYRPKRSAQDAVRTVHRSLGEGYTEVVDADLSKYFDTIPHHELMLCVARRVVDRHMLALVQMWLKSPVEERNADGSKKMSGGKDGTHGTPQGGVISPLLANIYMHRFLKAWRKQGKGIEFRARVVNYADDFVILTRGHAKAALEWTRHVITKIGLSLNEQKTSIRDGRREPFHFLGYTFGPMTSRRTGRRYLGAAPSAKARTKLREAVRKVLHRGNVAPWTEVVRKLNQVLRGWENYFSYGSVGRSYEAVNWMVLERTRNMLRRRHRVAASRAWRRFSAPEIYTKYGVHKLRRRNGMPTPWAVA
jgi:RNA-directed DNA polymerase